MKVYRLNDTGKSGGLVVSNPEDLVDELRACEVDDGPYYVFVEEMEEEKLKSLPDWDGF